MLDTHLSDTQRLCTFAHELDHAQHGDERCMPWSNCKAERRARRNTALRLIDPLQYRMSEHAYDGVRFLMAADLGVTLQVLEDYQALLVNGVVR